MLGARKIVLLVIILLVCIDASNSVWFTRRRRRRCTWYWNAWSACSTSCGPGTQTRTAGGCGAPGPQTQSCNARCYNGATTQPTLCACLSGYTDRCCGTRIRCSTLYAPSHGTLSGSFYYGDRVTVSCNAGYAIQGSTMRTCQSNGRWSGSQATCTRQSCGTLRAPANGGIRGTSFLYSDVVTFYCNTGYELSGSHSRTCQASQVWSGTPATCSRKACQAPVAPLNGYVSGVSHLYTDTMTFSCAVDLGYVMQGSSTTVCQADQTWSHGTPTCQLITCDQLDPSPNVVTVPGTCTTKRASFKENCVLSCEPGFTSTSGQTVFVTTCGASAVPGSANGTWSDSIDNFKCQDTTPPSIVCPNDIAGENDPGLDSAEVTWTAPVATDTTGVTPVVLSSVTPPHRFTIGVHTINYTAVDEGGLTTSCTFYVEIRDITDPVCVSCPEDINEVSSNRELSIQWDEPSWTDNSGNVADVFRSTNPGSLFYWGAPQLVYYIARDDAGNKGFCNFTVTVKQHSCPYQAPPQNGAIACDTWLGGQFCSVSCNRDFDFAREPESLYYCKQEEGGGRWSPFFLSFYEFIFPWPDCTRKTTPGAVVGLQVQYYTSDCDVDTEEIRQNFIEQAKILNFLAQGFCMDEAECNIENVQVSCGTPAARGARRSADNVINLDFDVVVALKESSSFNGSSVQSVTTQIDFLVLDIENTIADGGFNISVGNLTISTIPGSFNKITDTHLLCSLGSVLKNSTCLSCPAGTFDNGTSCQDCPPGSYQETEAQTSCLPCLNRTTTYYPRAVSAAECRETCEDYTIFDESAKECKNMSTTVGTGTGSLNCPPDTEAFSNSCYILMDQSADYMTARKICESGGGYLVVVKDEAEHQFLIDHLNSTVDIWIGLDDIINEGIFMYNDGSPLGAFTKWAYGEPNDGTGTQDCVHLWPLAGMTWDDTICTKEKLFVCEFEK